MFIPLADAWFKKLSIYSNTICIEQEFKKFAQNPEFRPQILEKLYNSLLGIPISSVEAERCFSITENSSTKLRFNLSDESLGALVFLKHNYFDEFFHCLHITSKQIDQ